jgi:hypothetical protein
MNKAKQLFLVNKCGIPKDSDLYKKISEAEASDVSNHKKEITKYDLFEIIGEESYFSYPQTWDNLGTLITYFEGRGTPLTANDFKTKIMGSITPIDLAKKLSKTDVFFQPELWAGNLREMDSLYFTIQGNWIKDSVYQDKRRQVAALSGDLTPEDKLEAMDVNLQRFRVFLSSGSHDAEFNKFKSAGGKLTKDFILMFDNLGETIFSMKATFANISSWWSEFEQTGDKFTKEDFLMKNGQHGSILDYAVRHDTLNTIFSPQIWKGNAQEMLALYEYVPETSKSKVDIFSMVHKLNEEKYSDYLVIDENISLGDLTRIINEEDKDLPHYVPLTALSFTSTWQSMDVINKALEERGEKITLDHLRAAKFSSGASVLNRVSELGHFPKVMEIAKNSKQRFTFEELTVSNDNEKSILHSASLRSEIPQLFDVEYWVGHGKEMAATYNALEVNKRKDIVFEELYSKSVMLSNRARFGGPSLN